MVVDALLGLGFKGPLRQPLANMLTIINKVEAYKIALDVPTGTDANTGSVVKPHFLADKTITFIAPKLGLLTGPCKKCGR